jgi:hypothetical protein
LAALECFKEHFPGMDLSDAFGGLESLRHQDPDKPTKVEEYTAKDNKVFKKREYYETLEKKLKSEKKNQEQEDYNVIIEYYSESEDEDRESNEPFYTTVERKRGKKLSKTLSKAFSKTLAKNLKEFN